MRDSAWPALSCSSSKVLIGFATVLAQGECQARLKGGNSRIGLSHLLEHVDDLCRPPLCDPNGGELPEIDHYCIGLTGQFAEVGSGIRKPLGLLEVSDRLS